MSTSRTFSKGLAIASNYDIPDVDSSVKTVYNFSAPTLFDGLEFGNLKLIEGAGYSLFNLHGISLSVEVPSTADITLSMHQADSGALITDTTFILPSGAQNASKTFLTTPVAGLAHNKSFYIRVAQASTSVLAEGAVISYILSDV